MSDPTPQLPERPESLPGLTHGGGRLFTETTAVAHFRKLERLLEKSLRREQIAVGYNNDLQEQLTAAEQSNAEREAEQLRKDLHGTDSLNCGAQGYAVMWEQKAMELESKLSTAEQSNAELRAERDMYKGNVEGLEAALQSARERLAEAKKELGR